MKAKTKTKKAKRYLIPNGGMPSEALFFNVRAVLNGLGTKLPVSERSTILVQSLACLVTEDPKSAVLMSSQLKGLREMVVDISKGKHQTQE